LVNAFRSLCASRAFTLVALAVLGLGIGAATAIFSVVDAVVLRGLPYDEHDRLGVIYEKDTRHATTFGLGNITPQTYLDWRPLQQPFQQIAAVGAALDKVALGLAEGHVQHCMAEGAGDPKRQQEMTEELMQALGRLVR
jgi:hypothetical protein